MFESITQEFLDAIKLPNTNAKKLKYLIVMPPETTSSETTYILPYGLCMVSSALKASGRICLTLNLNYKEKPYDLLKKIIVDNSIDCVLTGGLSGQYTTIKTIIDTAKVAKPDVVVCVGGGIMSAEPVIAMKALGVADYGIVGEGEIAVNAFAYALENNEDMNQVGSLVFYTGEEYIVTKKHKEIMNLDMLPFPDYDGFEYHMLVRAGLSHSEQRFSNKVMAFIAASRSCPYSCTFCFHSSGKKYRRRSIESIFKEIDYVVSKYGINTFYILDELFVMNEEFVEEFAKNIKSRNIKYYVQAHVGLLSKKIMQILKDSGCIHMLIGIESADNRILKSMKKNITVEQINQVLEWATDINLLTEGNIILGDLEETPETICNSLNWWKKNVIRHDIIINWILVFPGTHLYNLACERGIISDPVKYLQNNDTKINVTKMSDELYNAMEHKVVLFSILISDGIDIDFIDIDNIATRIGNNLIDMTKKYKVAIWPATHRSINMLDYLANGFIDDNNVFLVNTNPRNIFVDKTLLAEKGKKTERYNKVGYKPDEIINNNIDIVIYPNDCFRNKGWIIYNQIQDELKLKYPYVKRCLRISELL